LPCIVADASSSPKIPDLVGRRFDPGAPDVAWCQDIAHIPNGEGWLYLASVLDLGSRRLLGYSMADQMRTELVTDALHMAVSARAGQHVSWLVGTRLRAAGILGSMGSVGDCFDNSVAEAFFSGLQRELLDQHSLGHPRASRPSDLRPDRNLVQPPAPGQLHRMPQPHRLRNGQRGMIATPNLSVRTGYFHETSNPTLTQHHVDE
jgi:transposase InsO family protein